MLICFPTLHYPNLMFYTIAETQDVKPIHCYIVLTLLRAHPCPCQHPTAKTPNQHHDADRAGAVDPGAGLGGGLVGATKPDLVSGYPSSPSDPCKHMPYHVHKNGSSGQPQGFLLNTLCVPCKHGYGQPHGWWSVYCCSCWGPGPAHRSSPPLTCWSTHT